MRVSKKIFNSIFLASVILVFLNTVSAFAFSVNVGPPSVFTTSPAGETNSGTIWVENNSTYPITVTAYTEDWIFAPDGSKDFKPAGSTKLSCSNWITVIPSTFSIPAKTKKEVTYSINVPADSRGGHYSVIFFESKLGERTGEEEGTTVMLAARIGSIIYHSTEGRFTQKGEIRNLITSMSDPDKPFFLSFNLLNLGDVYLGADGTAVIFDSRGNLVSREKINKLNTLPGDAVKGKINFLGGLPKGEYKLVATLDFGGDAPLIKEEKFTIYKENPYISKFNALKSGNRIKLFAKVNNPRLTPVTVYGEFKIEDKAGKISDALVIHQTEIAGQTEKLIQGSSNKTLPPGEYKVSLTLNEFLTQETPLVIK